MGAAPAEASAVGSETRKQGIRVQLEQGTLTMKVRVEMGVEEVPWMDGCFLGGTLGCCVNEKG